MNAHIAKLIQQENLLSAPFTGKSHSLRFLHDKRFENYRGRGAGGLLLQELVARESRAGRNAMIASIGDSQNAASITLDRSCSFQHIGVLKSVGFKHGTFLDAMLMQLQP